MIKTFYNCVHKPSVVQVISLRHHAFSSVKREKNIQPHEVAEKEENDLIEENDLLDMLMKTSKPMKWTGTTGGDYISTKKINHSQKPKK